MNLNIPTLASSSTKASLNPSATFDIPNTPARKDLSPGYKRGCYATDRQLMSPWLCPPDNRVRDFNGLANPLPCLSVSPSCRVGDAFSAGTEVKLGAGWCDCGTSRVWGCSPAETATRGLSCAGEGTATIAGLYLAASTPCAPRDDRKPAPCADSSVR